MARRLGSLITILLLTTGCTFTGSVPWQSAGVISTTAPGTTPSLTPDPTTIASTPRPTATPRPQSAKSIEALAVGKRDLTPAASTADVRAVVRGDTDFALDLYQRLRKSEDGNIVIGPYSISVAFAMQHAGAQGRTATQIEQVLHYTLPTARLDAAFDRLSLELASRQNKRVTLAIANRLFGDRLLGDIPVPFRQSFLRELTRHFSAPMASVDFTNHAEAARRLINAWVARQTAGKITALIPKGELGRNTLSRNTVLALVNAMYLKARWASPFSANDTYDRRFDRLDGTHVKVPTMYQAATFPFVATKAYTAVELPYEGDQLAMLLVMPKPGTFAAFERSLDRAVLTKVIDGLRDRFTLLDLPTFSIRTELLGLGAVLKAMGITDAFDDTKADFYPMTTLKPGDVPRLYIAAVLHEAFITVAEKGTEAAAATAIIDAGTIGGYDHYVRATFDHPFLWFIRDRGTGTILFMGRVVDPSVTAD
jgi:serpin B